MFGPVSLSATLPQTAKELIVYFYQLHFPSDEPLARHRHPYRFIDRNLMTLVGQFEGQRYQDDFKRLKRLLAEMGVAVPTLYKQYGEFCRPGGVRFVDFGIDPDFAHCVDGLVVVELTQLKVKKRQRYLPTATGDVDAGANV